VTSALLGLPGCVDDAPNVLPRVAGDLDDLDLPHAFSSRLNDLLGEVEAALLDGDLCPPVGGRRSVQGCRHRVIVTDRRFAIQGWPPGVAPWGNIR
jgi:hypothetical protein